MAKVTVRDAILLNVFIAILLVIVTIVWSANALLWNKASAVFAPLPHSVAETLYKVGRYELLRDAAASCEKTLSQQTVTMLNALARADWDTAAVALIALVMLAFNIWFLRGIRREPSPQPNA